MSHIVLHVRVTQDRRSFQILSDGNMIIVPTHRKIGNVLSLKLPSVFHNRALNTINVHHKG